MVLRSYRLERGEYVGESFTCAPRYRRATCAPRHGTSASPRTTATRGRVGTVRGTGNASLLSTVLEQYVRGPLPTHFGRKHRRRRLGSELRRTGADIIPRGLCRDGAGTAEPVVQGADQLGRHAYVRARRSHRADRTESGTNLTLISRARCLCFKVRCQEGSIPARALGIFN